jgi:hypothetical protein
MLRPFADNGTTSQIIDRVSRSGTWVLSVPN